MVIAMSKEFTAKAGTSRSVISFAHVVSELSPLMKTRKTPTSLDLEYAGEEAFQLRKNYSPASVVKCSDTESFRDGASPQYLVDPEDRKKLLLVARRKGDDLLLYMKNESGDLILADTSEFDGKKGLGYSAYGMGKHGSLHIHEHIIGDTSGNNFFHSSFFAGESGKCFGMIKIKEGKIDYIDNHSGHYKPTVAQLADAVERLKPYFSKDAVVREADAADSGIGIGNLFGEQVSTVSEFLQEHSASQRGL